MTYKFTDRDIDEIFCDSTTDVLHINYIGQTASTYYTREDLERMMAILDGKEDGVLRKY
jgi:hypothetical protein